MKKKELAELDAVLAELGLSGNSSNAAQDDKNVEKKGVNQTGDGERKEDAPAPSESKTSKKKKKKDKSSKEAKAGEQNPSDTTPPPLPLAGTSPGKSEGVVVYMYSFLPLPSECVYNAKEDDKLLRCSSLARNCTPSKQFSYTLTWPD